jgi:hypothetical protein
MAVLLCESCYEKGAKNCNSAAHDSALKHDTARMLLRTSLDSSFSLECQQGAEQAAASLAALRAGGIAKNSQIPASSLVMPPCPAFA